MLEAILVSQKADQHWIETLSMFRRVHSTWNHVVQSICPELSPAVPRTPNQEKKETWLSTFHREQEGVKDRIRERREGPQPAFTYAASYIFNIIQSYPTNLDILTEAMISLSSSISPITDEVPDDTEFFTGNSHQNALYSILSRHVLRPTPYAALDIGGQRQEHIEITPSAEKVLNLGTRIIAFLTQHLHCCPQHLQTLLDSLHILTSARHSNDKQEKDWHLTLHTTQILRVNLHKFDSKDLKILGAKGEESLLSFVLTYLISHGSSWMIEQSFQGWQAIRAELTSSLYGIIKDLLRLQIEFRYDDVFTAIADSLTDSAPSDKLILYGLSFLHLIPILDRTILDKERYGSPFDGVILKILSSRWDTNRLNPGVWAKGHSQRMRMLTAGEALNPG